MRIFSLCKKTIFCQLTPIAPTENGGYALNTGPALQGSNVPYTNSCEEAGILTITPCTVPLYRTASACTESLCRERRISGSSRVATLALQTLNANIPPLHRYYALHMSPPIFPPNR